MAATGWTPSRLLRHFKSAARRPTSAWLQPPSVHTASPPLTLAPRHRVSHVGRNPLSHSPQANAHGLPSNTGHALTHPHLYTLMPTQKYTHTHAPMHHSHTHLLTLVLLHVPTHTRSDTHTPTLSHLQVHGHRNRTHIQMHAILTHARTWTHKHTHTGAQSQHILLTPTGTDTHKHTHVYAHAHTRSFTRACSHTHTHTQLATLAFDTGEGRQKCRQKSGSKAHTHPLYQNSPAQAAPVSGSPVSLLSFSCCPSRPLAAPQDPISVPGPPSPWPEHSLPHFSLFVHLSICYLETTGLGYLPANRNFSETTSHVFLPGTYKEHH